MEMAFLNAVQYNMTTARLKFKILQKAVDFVPYIDAIKIVSTNVLSH